MNMEDFQEKMDPTHRMYLCRMLNVKELPEDLLERYAKVKRLVDRIDGHLTPGDLAMIIISVGNNPEIATELLNESDDKVIEEAVEQPVEPPVEQAARYATGQAVTTVQATEQPTPDEGKAMILSPGMPVRVLHKEELKQGKIVGVQEPELHEVKPVKYTVEFEDGETETFDETEVEAI